MKKSALTFALTVLSIAALFYFTGCNDKGSVNAPWQMNFEMARFVVIDYGDVQNAVEDGTIENETTFNNTMLNYAFLDGDRPFKPGDPAMRGNQWFDRFDFGKHLGLFFPRLNLTDGQKTQVRDLMTTFHTSMKPLVRQYYDANKGIINDANAKRQLILDSLKAARITREQASADLRSLNQATHLLIDNNPASKTIKAAMCTERNTLFAGIRAVLQGDQITKWDDWISKIKNPCTP